VRWKTLGRIGTIALKKARRLATEDRGIVARGGDPSQQKDDARGAATVGDVADRFLDEHVEARRKPATQRLYRLAIDGHLRPRLGLMSIADVRPADIVKLHQRLRSTPYLGRGCNRPDVGSEAARDDYLAEGRHATRSTGVTRDLVRRVESRECCRRGRRA
jgi:hypothetical protein